MEEKLDLDVEPITTHVSVPCTKSWATRHRNLSRKLEDMKKKKVMTRMLREAMEDVIVRLEQAVEEEQTRSA